MYYTHEHSYVFRKDPVPGTGKKRCSISWRHLRPWFGAFRDGRTREFREFVRYEADWTPLWDGEFWQHKDRSWKTSCKCRCQWQKRFRRGRLERKKRPTWEEDFGEPKSFFKKPEGTVVINESINRRG